MCGAGDGHHRREAFFSTSEARARDVSVYDVIGTPGIGASCPHILLHAPPHTFARAMQPGFHRRYAEAQIARHFLVG